MESNIYYVNFDKSASTTDLQTPNHKPDEGKAQNCRGSVCLVLMTVCLGLICVLLLIFIILQFIIITAERDLVKSYKNTVEDFNQTINRLQKNYTDLTQKKLELESKVTSLSDELKKAYEKGLLFISNELKNWSESRQFCRNQGADLVIINTEEKQKFISSFINEINARVWKKTIWEGGVWIGLTDRDQEGNMKWVENSTLKQGFWFQGQPDDGNGSEDCVELMPTLSVLNWNDLPCSYGIYGICEKKWG